MSELIHFFAYDTLMNEGYFKEMGLDCKASFSVTLSAYRVVFNKIPHEEGTPEGLGLANIEPTPSESGMLFGVMYEMDDRFLPRLDEIHRSPEETVRKVLRLTKHDFTRVNGFTYLARPEYTLPRLKPDKATMKIIKGARKKLPLLYFSRIMTTPTVD
ncbi:MAG: gamma-glutamylcyclotransferase family protein [Nitrospinaceae bacterium]